MPPRVKQNAVETESTAPAVESDATAPQTEPITPQTKLVTKVRAVKDAMHHPFQKRWIGVETEGIEVTLDSWVECQIEAGFLEEVVVV